MMIKISFLAKSSNLRNIQVCGESQMLVGGKVSTLDDRGRGGEGSKKRRRERRRLNKRKNKKTKKKEDERKNS